jgi:hypothetical protein
MSDQSSIEWTDATWNPVRGCTKISPGCAHCYAETFAERFRGVRGHPYEQGFDLLLVPHKLEEPLRWRSSRMVFVNSMSDLFSSRCAGRLHRRRRKGDAGRELAHVPSADQALREAGVTAKDEASSCRFKSSYLVGSERREPKARTAAYRPSEIRGSSRSISFDRASPGGSRHD